MTKQQQNFTEWKLRQMTEVSTVFDSKVGIKKKIDHHNEWIMDDDLFKVDLII